MSVMYSEEFLGIPDQAGICNCSDMYLARALSQAGEPRSPT